MLYALLRLLVRALLIICATSLTRRCLLIICAASLASLHSLFFFQYYSSLAYDKATKSFVQSNEQVFDLPIFSVALVSIGCGLLTSGIAIIPFLNQFYFDSMETGVNYFKWFDYIISSTSMLLLTSTVFGQGNLNALIPIIGVSVASGVFLMLYESTNTHSGELAVRPNNVFLFWTLFIWLFVVPSFVLSAYLGARSDGWNFGKFLVLRYAAAPPCAGNLTKKNHIFHVCTYYANTLPHPPLKTNNRILRGVDVCRTWGLRLIPPLFRSQPSLLLWGLRRMGTRWVRIHREGSHCSIFRVQERTTVDSLCVQSLTAVLC